MAAKRQNWNREREQWQGQGRYGDARDEAFERGETDTLGSMSGQSFPYEYGLDAGHSYPGSRLGRAPVVQRPGQYAGRGPQGYHRSDELILEDACEILTQHGDIDATGIQVSVENGEIWLKGTVPERRMKRLAAAALENIAGVQDVHNRLVLLP